MMIKYGKESPAIYQLCFNHGIHLAVCDTLYNKKQIFEFERIQNVCDNDDDNNLILNDGDSDSEDCFEDIYDEANNFSRLDVEFKNILNIQENIKNVRKLCVF